MAVQKGTGVRPGEEISQSKQGKGKKRDGNAE